MIKNGWLDWAIRRDGPSWKQNVGSNGLLGIAHHSAEGWELGLWSVLDGPRRASWNFSLMRDGRLFQHYPITSRTWTSGSGFPNNNFWGLEAEGIAGMPLTSAQLAAVIRLNRELMDFTKRDIATRNLSRAGQANYHTLGEHNEFTIWGSMPTSCPSNRYNWNTILAGLEPPVVKPNPVEPEPEPIIDFEGEDDMAVIIQEPGVPRTYLNKGRHLAWIPDKETYDDLAAIHGEAHKVSPRTFQWLVDQHKSAGFRWGN